MRHLIRIFRDGQLCSFTEFTKRSKVVNINTLAFDYLSLKDAWSLTIVDEKSTTIFYISNYWKTKTNIYTLFSYQRLSSKIFILNVDTNNNTKKLFTLVHIKNVYQYLYYPNTIILCYPV